ncbi:MAG: peptidylprolyl isomerase [Rikenella sp.]|nr:peptidylprolyl isomerase [Rikenella sp.]
MNVKVIKKSRLWLTVAFCGLLTLSAAQAERKRTLVAGQGARYVATIKTSKGTVRFRLFNDTPIHRDNFVRLAEQGFYNNLLFHRVIRDFMIQTGDPESVEASQVKVYGEADAGYKLDAEILPHYYHRRGVVAAAREGDAENPTRRSSGSQFYIVVGRIQNDSTLAGAREKIAARAADPTAAQITPEREKVYRKQGGTPHLDGSYTIFGEVISGIGVVRRISELPTDLQDRPKNEDIHIKNIKIKLVKGR